MDAFTPIIIKCLTCHCSARLFPWGCSDPSLVRSSYRPSFMLYLGVWIVVSATQKVAIVCIREVINHTVFSLLWSYCHSLHSIHHATMDKCRLSRICPPPKKKIHIQVLSWPESSYIHTPKADTPPSHNHYECASYTWRIRQRQMTDWTQKGIRKALILSSTLTRCLKKPQGSYLTASPWYSFCFQQERGSLEVCWSTELQKKKKYKHNINSVSTLTKKWEISSYKEV